MVAVNPNELMIGDKVLVINQPNKYGMLRGTVGEVTTFNQVRARIQTKFPNGTWFASWVDLHNLVRLPKEVDNV
jgi:hypothetical protein